MVDEVCDIFGISRKTYYKWYNRDHGYGQNRYRPRRIHPHTKITKMIRLTICEIKLKYNYGPLRMQQYLLEQCGIRISTTAIYKYFKKRKLIRKPQRKQTWYRPMKESFKAKIPGENTIGCKICPWKGSNMELPISLYRHGHEYAIRD